MFLQRKHYLKKVRIRKFSGPQFLTFELSTKIYKLNLHIQSESWKIQTRKFPNTDTFYGVITYQD